MSTDLLEIARFWLCTKMPSLTGHTAPLRIHNIYAKIKDDIFSTTQEKTH